MTRSLYWALVDAIGRRVHRRYEVASRLRYRPVRERALAWAEYLTGLSLLLALGSPAEPPQAAKSITLGWNPVPGASSYALWHGVKSNAFYRVWTGRETQATLRGFWTGPNWFSVSVTMPNGLSSRLAAPIEHVWLAPGPTPPGPAPTPKVSRSGQGPP
jgi:hypothetical protein